MKLSLRLTALMFVVLTIATSSIGFFAIAKYRSTEIGRIDQSLQAKITVLDHTQQDPLSVMQYLAQVSVLPVTAAYITNTNDFNTLTFGGQDFLTRPTLSQVISADYHPVNISNQMRMRTFELPNDEYLVMAESTADINKSVGLLAKDLVGFIIVIDLLGIFTTYIFFRNDLKLNELNIALRKQSESMQEFLGDASHELRTPLTVIKGYFELAQRAEDKQTSAKYLAKSESEIIRMETLIREILLLAELGEWPISHKQSVDFSAMLEEQIRTMQDLSPSRTLSADVASGIQIQGDQGLLTQMLANIFANIRQHTPADAPVEIRLTSTRNRVELMVGDGGPGLPESLVTSRIFTRFDKSRARTTGGSGLGMSIIQAIVKAHDGSFSVANSSLGGLGIRITFPAS